MCAAGRQPPALSGGVQTPGTDQVQAGQGHLLIPAAAKFRDDEGDGLSTWVALRMRVTTIDRRLACSGGSFAVYAMCNFVVYSTTVRLKIE